MAHHPPSAGITRIRFKGSMATKPSSQPGLIPAPRRENACELGYLSAGPKDSVVDHSVSLKKYRGHCGQPDSWGLGLKSTSSSIPIFRDSSLDVRMILGTLTPSGISTIPTA